MHSGSSQGDSSSRILVIAYETAADEALLAEIVQRALGTDAEVLVVFPALDTSRRLWLSGDDDAVAKASVQLMASLEALEGVGIAARGHLGDANPVQALRDAVAAFEPTEILVSGPPGESSWVRRFDRIRKSLDLPVTQVTAAPPGGTRPGDGPS